MPEGFKCELIDGVVYVSCPAKIEHGKPDFQGVLRSRVFPGLWLDASALLAGDGARVLAVLRRGLDSAAHVAFARELEKRLARARRGRSRGR